jgi:hypothetical protein
MKTPGWMFLILVLLSVIGAAPLCAEEEGSDGGESAEETQPTIDDGGYKNNDGQEFNKRSSIILLLGPGAAQNGQPNPMGLPPSIVDIEFTYVHPSGFETAIGIIPGLMFGARYRVGEILYGSAGAGLIISANGVGPGVYTTVGATFARTQNVTFDIAVKQALAIVESSGGTSVTMPYALRLGMGYHW